MGIVSKIGEAFGFSGSETYEYECDDCGASFESTVPSPSLVSCPECKGEAVTRMDAAE